MNEQTMTKEEKTLTAITSSIIANQIAYDLNHEIRFTGYYKHNLKNALNRLLPLLKKAEQQEFDKFFDTQEKATNELYQAQTEMIAEISQLGIIHFQNITEIIRAYKKSPKSIQGIINKINK